MFINALKKQNPKLIETAIELHGQGVILPDTYVIDVDQFIENATLIKKIADTNNVKLYGMTKQFGRNPVLAKILISIGYEGIVAVDFKEARTLHQAGIKISHVGHLVQPPTGIIRELVQEIKPEVITVYSIEKAVTISKMALEVGIVQKILLKFYDKNDHLYVNQESGFSISSINDVLERISQLENVEIHGVTHFPCFLYKKGKTKSTENLNTLLNAKRHIESLGLPVMQVNSPSSTSCETLPIIAEFDCTHGEPGHALTGTTPANHDGSTQEKVAMLYLSEVSHEFNGKSYCYGGGYYRRGNLNNALINGVNIKVTNTDHSAIDYHLLLDGIFPIGSSVIMAFRTQVFVTRSDVALIAGISEGKPRLLGLYNSLGGEI